MNYILDIFFNHTNEIIDVDKFFYYIYYNYYLTQLNFNDYISLLIVNKELNLYMKKMKYLFFDITALDRALYYELKTHNRHFLFENIDPLFTERFLQIFGYVYDKYYDFSDKFIYEYYNSYGEDDLNDTYNESPWHVV